MPKPDTKPSPDRLSRDATFQMTPAQHRTAAEQLRMQAQQPGAPDPERAQMLAANHDLVAQAIERRLKPN